jgi:hypothetical protein
LPEAINEGQYLVPRMTRDERRDAISGPVAVGGATITPRLLNQLLNDVGDNPDQLPILQHALMRTWDVWKAKQNPDAAIDVEEYEETGTMAQALSQHAEEAYNELKTDRQKEICESLFKGLTDRGSDARGIRRPTKLSELNKLSNASSAEVIEVIEVFRQPGRSFLMPPASVTITDDTIIDISHESLMRCWSRLINWVEEENQSVIFICVYVKQPICTNWVKVDYGEIQNCSWLGNGKKKPIQMPLGHLDTTTILKKQCSF